MVMESSMFCYDIGKLISKHTGVGLNFVKVYRSVWFADQGDDLLQEFDMCVLPM